VDATPKEKRKPRLLFIASDTPFFITHFLPLALAAQAQGYDVHVASPLDPESGRGDVEAADRLRGAGLAFHEIGLKRADTNPLGELALLAELSSLIKRLSPDLIHGLGLKPVLYAGSIARLKGISSVHAVIGLGLPFMGEGLGPRFRRALLRIALGFVFANPKSWVTVENEDDRAIVLSTGSAKPARISRFYGVGADLDLFHPRPETAPSEAPVIMFAARLIAPKGIYDFVEAARRLHARGLGARFVLQCQPDPRNRNAVSEDEVKAWAREGIIEWWGNSTKMAEDLRRADIFCLPTYYREGLPKVLIEAAATGLPIVTTTVTGCRDVVNDGQNGILIAPRDVGALETALARLITDVAFRRAAGVRSRKIAEERFSVAFFLKTYLGIYDALLSSRARVK
jgi:glycosyltransferase involved in cell wall biosynthesis